MKGKKRYVKETIALILPYLLITAVLIAFFLIATTAFYDYISRNAEREAYNRIDDLSDEAYNWITTYKKACIILSANNAVLSFPDAPVQDEYETQMMVNSLRQEMRYVMSLAHIPYVSVGIYYPQMQAIISENREYWGGDSCDTYLSTLSGGTLSRKLFEEIPGGYSWSVRYNDGEGYFIYQLIKQDRTAAYIILECDLGQLVSVPKEGGIVLVGDDDTLYYSSDSGISEELSGAIMEQTRKNHRFKYSGEEYISYRCIFSMMQTEILIAVSVDQITTETASFQTMIIAVGISGAISLALIFLNMYKRIILPYRYLAEAAVPGTEGNGVRRDVLTLARANLLALKRQQKAAEEERKLLVHLGVGELLQQLRSAPKEHGTLSKRCLSLAGIPPGQRYAVFAVFHMEDQEQVFQSMQSACEQVTPLFVLENVLQDLLFFSRVGVIATIEHYYVVISAVHDEDTEETLNEIIDRLTQFYQDNYNVTIAGTQPLIGDAPEDLYTIITKTMNDVDYLYFWQKNRLSLTEDGEAENDETGDIGEERAEREDEDTEGAKKGELISYFKAMRNMVNRLDNRDYTGAQAVFRQIMDDNLSRDAQDFQITKYRIYGMIEMLIGAISEQSVVGMDTFNELNIEQRLYETDTISSFRVTAEQIFDGLMDIRQQYDGIDSRKKKLENVKAYIDSHYTDNSLTAASVAEHFDLSASYVSREFKRMAGCNMLEYIQRLRVKQAKALLLEHSVKEAALRSGFWDTQSLVRVFKKYEGVTPGEYKKSMGQ